QPLDVGRRHLIDEVHIAGEEGGDTGRIRLDRLDRDLVEGGLLAPIAVIALDYDAVTRDPFHEFVSTGTDGGLSGVEVAGRGTFRGLLRDDVDGRHVVRHQRIGLRRLDADGEVV